MGRKLRILSIEDDPKDAELIQDLLEAENIACEVTRVDTQAALMASLEQGGIDLILADYSLPILRWDFRIEGRNKNLPGRAVHLCFRNAR